MQGNLNHPPIIITPPKKKIAVGFVIAGAAVLLTLFIPQTPTLARFLAWAFTLSFAVTLVIGPRLTISQNGLLHSSLLFKKSWVWADFDHFEVFEMPLLGVTSPGCRFSEAYIRTIQPIPDPLVDCSRGAIGLFWEVPAPQLVSLLNEARQRWSPPATTVDPLS